MRAGYGVEEEGEKEYGVLILFHLTGFKSALHDEIRIEYGCFAAFLL
jgi:hypothetical protein